MFTSKSTSVARGHEVSSDTIPWLILLSKTCLLEQSLLGWGGFHAVGGPV